MHNLYKRFKSVSLVSKRINTNGRIIYTDERVITFRNLCIDELFTTADQIRNIKTTKTMKKLVNQYLHAAFQDLRSLD